MKFNLGLLAALFAAGAVTAENVCETSDASPYLHNVDEMIDNLKNAEMGKNACNFATNGCGETITAYSGSGGAAFMLCGSSFRCSGDPGGMPCAGTSCGGMWFRMIGGDLQSLRDECQSPDSKGDIRVGGYVSMDDGDNKIKLFSKPG